MNKPERAIANVGPDAKPDPDVFSNTQWMVGEIVLAHQIIGRKINALKIQNAEKSTIGQKLAAEEVAKLAEQLKVCADIIVRKSAEHANRRSRS